MTENKPHVVYRARDFTGWICPTYAKAHALWKDNHRHDNPWLIATLGRVIDPDQPIIDVSE
jgi:hypothetical protein